MSKSQDDKELMDLGAEPHDSELAALGAISPEDKEKVGKWATAPEKTSEGQALLGGAQQGLTLGHADELGGLMGAGWETGANALGMGPDSKLPPDLQSKKSITDLYKEYRDMQRKQFKNEESEHPKTFITGNLGGGVLGAVGGGLALRGAGALAGGAEAADNARKATTFAQRLRNGVGTGAAIGAVSGEGNSEHDLLSPEMAGDIGEGMEAGAITGGVLTPAVEGATVAAKGTAKAIAAGAKRVGEATLPDVPGAFMRGFGRDGRGSGEWLLGPKAQQETSDMIYNAGGEIPIHIENTLNDLASTKKQIIETASAKGIKIDPEKIDEFIHRYTGNDPNHFDPKVQSELTEFHNLLKNAKDGNEVEKVTRVFFGNGNTERGQFAQLFAQKQAEEQMQMAPDVPAPQTEKEAFERLYAQKQAEQQALPGAMSSAPLEQTYEAIPGETDDVLGVIRQKQFDADGNFTGYKKIVTKRITPDAPPTDLPQLEMILQPLPDQPGKSLGVIRKAVLDDNGNITGYKIFAKKALNDQDAALFKDMSDIVRVGGKDLTDPKELLEVYKSLKERTYGPNAYKTKTAYNQANTARADIQNMLRAPEVAPELEGVDKKIENLNQAKSSAGLPESYDKDQVVTDQNGKIVNLDPDVNKIVGKMIINATGDTEEASAVREKLQNLITKLKAVDPSYGEKFEKTVQDLQERSRTTEAVQEKAYARRWTATPRAWMNKGANAAGYGVGWATPDWMRATASKLSKGTGAAQEVAKVLMKAADADDQGRNALMFGLMQNAAYQKVLKDNYPTMDEAK